MVSSQDRAIVLSNIKYQESSSIVTLYTLEGGLKSCIIRGGRKKTAKVRSVLFQPLQLLDVVLYNNSKSSLSFVKEAVIALNENSIWLSPVKSSLTFFLTETIRLSLKDSSPNPRLFSFLLSAIYALKEKEDRLLKDFHICFMYRFASLLGFEPMDNWDSDNSYFDIALGTFSSVQNQETLSRELSLEFHNFISQCNDFAPYTTSSLLRKDLLAAFVMFYEHHITENRRIVSHQILSELM